MKDVKGMEWRKEFDSNYTHYINFLLYAMTFLLIISIFSKKIYLFAIIGLFTAYLLLSKWYDAVLARNLFLYNTKKNNIRLFQGEHDEIMFQFKNHARIPFLNGVFEFQIGSEIEIDGHKTEEKLRSVKVPFSITGKGKTTLKLPITAIRRGTVTITRISYEFPHLFNFNIVRLHYLPYYHQEIIVYPKLKPVQGLEELTQVQDGNQRTYYSPFEDILSPIGTRNYEFSDSFQRINWKATAKTQQLQTNVYDKVVEHSFLFIVNLQSKCRWDSMETSQYQEDILSYTAYLCHHATKEGHPYEIYMNDRRLGKANYAHLPEGEGKPHYAHSLEMLARVRKYTLIYPFDHMIYQVGQRLGKPRTVIIVGDIQPKDRKMLYLWSKQHHIFYTHMTTDGAFINLWNKGVIGHAE